MQLLEHLFKEIFIYKKSQLPIQSYYWKLYEYDVVNQVGFKSILYRATKSKKTLFYKSIHTPFRINRVCYDQ